MKGKEGFNVDEWQWNDDWGLTLTKKDCEEHLNSKL